MSQTMNKLSVQERSQAYADVECPHCGRRFNEKAAQRHIPICGQRQQKPPVVGFAKRRHTAGSVRQSQESMPTESSPTKHRGSFVTGAHNFNRAQMSPRRTQHPVSSSRQSDRPSTNKGSSGKIASPRRQ